MEAYHKIGTLRRTVLRRMPLGLVDLQALPPRGWCVRCGAEIYRRGQDRCNRCRAREWVRVDS